MSRGLQPARSLRLSIHLHNTTSQFASILSCLTPVAKRPKQAYPERMSEPLTHSLQRELKRRGHRLKARILVGRGGLSLGFLEQLRKNLAETDLLKVRIEADDAAETKRVAAELAQLVHCHLIQRVGRVALLYLPPAPPGDLVTREDVRG